MEEGFLFGLFKEGDDIEIRGDANNAASFLACVGVGMPVPVGFGYIDGIELS